MDDKNLEQIQRNNEEGKSKSKIFWSNFGLFVLALGLAIITVVMLNLK